MVEVEISSQADEHLANLDPTAREQVLKELAQVRDWPEHHLDPLSGWEFYKLRAGDYRAIVSWDRDRDVVLVKAVGHRRNVYDRHLPP